MLVLGLLVALASTCCMNYGVFLLKREVDLLPRLEVHSLWRTLKAFITSRPWLKAQGLQFSGGMLHIIAIGLAPLSLVEPIDTAGICFLVILSVIYLGERARLSDWLGIAVILVGITLLGITMVKPSEAFSYRPIVTWFFIIVLAGLVIRSFYIAFSRTGEDTSIFAGIGLGVLIGLNAVLIKLAWSDVGNLWHVYHLGSLWRSSYAIMALLGSIFAQVIFQVALQRGRALLIVPLVTGLSNMIPIMVGVLALKDPFPTQFKMIMLRLLAFLLIIGGAVLLGLKRPDQPGTSQAGAV